MDTNESKWTIKDEIDALLLKMKTIQPDSEEYAKMAQNVKTLMEARGQKSHADISVDTILAVAANIAGLLIVLNFEKANVITSKAFTMLFKRN